MTAGSIFDRTRTPLTVWFAACWQFVSGKVGVSALHLKRTLETGSYQTAWAMLHRFGSVLVRPDRDRLSGRVEVDGTYIGGLEPGLPGGRAKGKKDLTGIAVEAPAEGGFGRCRMAPLENAKAATLRAFIQDNVAPRSLIVTDGWGGYRSISRYGYSHECHNQRATRAHASHPEEAHRLSPQKQHENAAVPLRSVPRDLQPGAPARGAEHGNPGLGLPPITPALLGEA